MEKTAVFLTYPFGTATIVAMVATQSSSLLHNSITATVVAMATEKRRVRYPIALEEEQRIKLRLMSIAHGWSAESLGAWLMVHAMEQVEKGKLKIPKPKGN